MYYVRITYDVICICDAGDSENCTDEMEPNGSKEASKYISCGHGLCDIIHTDVICVYSSCNVI